MLALVVAVACGGGPSGGSLSDAFVVDAPQSQDGFATGVIKLTVRDGSGPFPSIGESVVFTDAFQTQVVSTDTNGEASAVVSGQTTVTHLHWLNAQDIEAKTIVGALPGDELLLERIVRDHTVRAPVTINFTPQTNVTFVGCGPCGCGSAAVAPSGSVSVPMEQHCLQNPLSVTLVRSELGVISYATDTIAYDPTAGGNATFATFTAGPVYTGTFTNNSVSGWIKFSFDGGGYQNTDQAYPAAAQETLQVTGWNGVPGRLVAAFSGFSWQYVFTDVTSSTSGYSEDVGASLLAFIGQPTFDSATETLDVPTTIAGAAGDLFIGTVGYDRAAGGTAFWTIFADAPGTFRMPYVPTSVADVKPVTAPTTGLVGAHILAVDSIAGYQEARRDPMGLWRRLRPGGGTIRLSAHPGPLPYEP